MCPSSRYSEPRRRPTAGCRVCVTRDCFLRISLEAKATACVRVWITWSFLPHMTCKGAVIRCKCSCKAYRDVSPTISIKTVEKRKPIYSYAPRSPGIFGESVSTNLLRKMCCEAAEHLPALEESNNDITCIKQQPHRLTLMPKRIPRCSRFLAAPRS